MRRGFFNISLWTSSDGRGKLNKILHQFFLCAASSTLNSFKSFNDKLNYVARGKNAKKHLITNA